ncbi:MAG: adenylosuccinate synthase [Kiritimatiellae bacterium]|nr:adenylosuccinate synthase [Kiritimatiellia bacterium]
MPTTVLVGAQWGDEGKGKIIDVLSEDTDVVVRFQGGSNAGHTVIVGDEKYVLHLMPSGILHPGKVCIIGNGVVVNPVALVDEVNELVERGVDFEGRFFVSDRAHVVLPYHGALDSQREALSTGSEKIGTTKRGIGPAYSDKVARVGLRMGDLVSPDFPELLKGRVENANQVLIAMGAEALDYDDICREYSAMADRLRPYVADCVPILIGALKENKNILFEGAQGTMLDIDFGTFPYVTSSNATAGGACTGTGIPPNRIDQVLGVVKAYTTRVGEGPFPTELLDVDGETLAREGHEFGATTGRPRRCGWFDAVVARYAADINGIDQWAITKLDVLDTFERIKIAVAYEVDGERCESIPASVTKLARCKPIYEEMPGWLTRTSEMTSLEQLPQAARNYLDRLCELTGVEMGILSVGAGRRQTLRIKI